MEADTPEPVLELAGIRKSFDDIPVLRDVRLRLYPGEIHALMGQNGAGKSTLIKVLTGVLASSGGEMRLSGRAIRPMTRLRWTLGKAYGTPEGLRDLHPGPDWEDDE